MNFLVVMKMVPDVVEELEVSSDGKSLDQDLLRMIVSESDDFALEQALLLREKHGGKITVVALEAPEIDDALFTALAKGADRAVKVAGVEPGVTTRVAAGLLASVIRDTPGLLPVDLILTGSQAIDDIDGLVAPMLAQTLDWPYLGIVTEIIPAAAGGHATVVKEYAGGVHGEFETPLPAVLGIQSAERPPRYVPVARVRAAMKTQKIDTVQAPESIKAPFAEIVAMNKPTVSGGAEMITGEPEEVAEKLCAILAERGML